MTRDPIRTLSFVVHQLCEMEDKQIFSRCTARKICVHDTQPRCLGTCKARTQMGTFICASGCSLIITPLHAGPDLSPTCGTNHVCCADNQCCVTDEFSCSNKCPTSSTDKDGSNFVVLLEALFHHGSTLKGTCQCEPRPSALNLWRTLCSYCRSRQQYPCRDHCWHAHRRTQPWTP